MIQTDREYATALFELAVEEGTVEEYLDALRVIKKLVEENYEYTDFLSSPAIPLKERIDAIDEAFGKSFPENVTSFVKILCENARVRTLVGCIDEFSKLTMVMSNMTTANVYSAVALSDEQKKNVCKKLEKLTGKIVEPSYIIDESLIGGLKIEVEGKTYDGSIKHRLSDLKDVMIG